MYVWKQNLEDLAVFVSADIRQLCTENYVQSSAAFINDLFIVKLDMPSHHVTASLGFCGNTNSFRSDKQKIY